MKKEPVFNQDQFFSAFRNWHTPNTYGEEYSSIPKKPGVYLLCSTVLPDETSQTIIREVLYIGSAKNLYQRYERHEVARILRQIYKYVQFFFIEEENYKHIEKYLIKLHQPKFNKQWR